MLPSAVVSYDPVTLQPLRRIPVAEGYTESFVLDDGEGGMLISGHDGLRTHRRDDRRRAVAAQPNGVRRGRAHGTGTMLCNDGTGTIVEREIATGEATGREYPNLSDWTQNSVVIPGSGEFLSFADRERASVYLWRIDDEPSITTPIARGQSAADGFGDHSGLIITATPTTTAISRTADCGMSRRMRPSVMRRMS